MTWVAESLPAEGRLSMEVQSPWSPLTLRALTSGNHLSALYSLRSLC